MHNRLFVEVDNNNSQTIPVNKSKTRQKENIETSNNNENKPTYKAPRNTNQVKKKKYINQ